MITSMFFMPTAALTRRRPSVLPSSRVETELSAGTTSGGHTGCDANSTTRVTSSTTLLRPLLSIPGRRKKEDLSVPARSWWKKPTVLFSDLSVGGASGGGGGACCAAFWFFAASAFILLITSCGSRFIWNMLCRCLMTDMRDVCVGASLSSGSSSSSSMHTSHSKWRRRRTSKCPTLCSSSPMTSAPRGCGSDCCPPCLVPRFASATPGTGLSIALGM
mmetsp:Transcript_37769/g.83145  ORF Transcript_37769/g.83145 Transcript_37769/m.83145 type:complete len:218 (+) Transcript_37769:1180-1833(+)